MCSVNVTIMITYKKHFTEVWLTCKKLCPGNHQGWEHIRPLLESPPTQSLLLLLFYGEMLNIRSVLCGAAFSCSVMSDSLRPHGLQPSSRLLCPWRFSRQEYWNGLPYPPPGDHPNPRIKPRSPALQLDSLLTEPPGKPNVRSTSLADFQYTKEYC